MDSRAFLGAVKAHPERYFIIHYSSQSLYDDDQQGLSPRITSIVVRHLATGQTVSFAMHAVAEELGIARDNIAGEYDRIETELLERFYAFARDRRVQNCWGGRPRRHRVCQIEVVGDPQTREPSMGKLTRIGLDTSKNVFQLHGVDDAEQPALKRKLRRQDLNKFFGSVPRLRIGMEACGASHHWARELQALGHEVVLIPPQYTKPYVDRGKNDAADAAAICEAMSRPKVQRRFVPVKTLDQQALQMLMGVRNGLVKRRTQVSNAIRGHAAEFGIVSAKGLYRVEELLAKIEQSQVMPELARQMFKVLAGQYRNAEAQIQEIEATLMAQHRSNEVSQRLAAIPSVGPIGALSMAAKIGDARRFRSGRDFAAFIGLTPKDHSTAGRKKLGGITRAGDEMLRSHLVCGATAVIRQLKHGRGLNSLWLKELVARKPEKLAAVAFANKTARIAWKLMISGEHYRSNYAEAA